MIIVYSRSASATFPTTNLTGRWDFSDITSLYKTFTDINNPCYTVQATADGDLIAVAVSQYPTPTSEWTLHNGASPTLRLTSPLLGTQCLDFDGVNDNLTMGARAGGSRAISNLFAVGGKTCAISFRCESLPATGELQPMLVSKNNFNCGVYVYNPSGTAKILANNNDGSYDNCIGDTVVVDTNYVAVMRHDGSNLYVSLNGGSETSAASGNTASLSETTAMGFAGSGQFYNGRIGEVLTYNAALTGTDLSNLITYMTNKWL